MKEKLNITSLSLVLINVMYVKLLLVVPRNIVLAAGNAAWILCIYVTLLELLFFFLISKVYDFSKNLMDIKGVLKKVIGILAGAFLVLSMSSVVKIYPETVKIILLKNTPTEIIYIIFSVAAVIGAYMGIESLGKICSLFQPIATAVMVLCFLFLIPNMHLYNLTPVLGKGIKGIGLDGLTILSVFSDIFLIFLIAPKGVESKEIRRAGFKAIIIMGFILTIAMLGYSMIFPYDVSEDFVLPLYNTVRLIQLSDFFGRFEAFFEFVWTISILIYLSVYLYALSFVWKEAFDLKFQKPLIAPFMSFVALLSYSSVSYIEQNRNFTVYSIILIGLALLLPVASCLIRSRERRKI